MPASPDRLPTLFIPHGGGPWPFMTPPGQPSPWDSLAVYLRGLDRSLGRRPKAVLVISGHWEEPRATVNVASKPPLLFDYDGFPDHTYRLRYDAPGSPAVAARVQALLGAAGIATGEDAERGYDHGVFVPFMLIYPDADVPIVQLSLNKNLDARTHLAIGRALAPLRDEGVLIVGSGMSFHNLRSFNDPRAVPASERFDAWLKDTVEDSDPARRESLLADWTKAPDALYCHPRPEHLLPLFVAAGAAENDVGRQTYGDHLMHTAVSGFQFG